MADGLFIVFEGVDGSGKATQSKLLLDTLHARDIAAERIEIPAYERNVFGKLIRECLDGKHGDFVRMDPKIVSTLYACDRFEYAPFIREKREAGAVVIADRFTSSNKIHQGGKVRDAAEKEEIVAWIDHVEHEVLGIPRPDLIVYLDVSFETSRRLIEARYADGSGNPDTVETDLTYLRQSQEMGAWLAGREPGWHRIACESDGSLRTIEDIQAEIYDVVALRLGI